MHAPPKGKSSVRNYLFFLKKDYCSVLRNVTVLFIAISDTAFSITIDITSKRTGKYLCSY